MTNADYIRQMDDERMFRFLNSFKEGDIDYARTFCDMCEQVAKMNGESTDCDGCLKWWLAQDSKMPHFGLEDWAFAPWNERSEE
jgi:hypothetical protein